MSHCPIVEFIAARSGMSTRMLTEHVDDGTGHCRGCAWQDGARPTHPCLIRHYAEQAAVEERRRMLCR